MISAKTYSKAISIEHAISLAKENEGKSRFLAGGTDVIVNKYQGNDDSDVLIDISGIAALKEITVSETFLSIGSLVCLEDLQFHSKITELFPLLSEAAHSVASPTIRKTATLGGNLLCENRCSFYNQSEWWREAAGYCLKCNGNTCLATGGTKNCLSKFVSDTAVALISLFANIEVMDSRGKTIIPLENIYSGDGVNPRLLSQDSLIVAIHLPLNESIRAVYKKLRKRETLDFTSLTTSVSIDDTGKIRIVLGGVHTKPVIVDGFMGDDLESLTSQAISNTRLVDNDTYSKSYRKEMIPVFLKRSFKQLGLI
ncbi:MAG: FAD binding domain-containing protein [Bacteroidota bacterium]